MDTISPFENIKRCQDNIFEKMFYFLSEDFFTFTNSVDPDEMQHYAAFHLGLHCLQKYSFRGFSNTKNITKLNRIKEKHDNIWVSSNGKDVYPMHSQFINILF